MKAEDMTAENELGRQVGEKLRHYRTVSGMSMEAFAKQIGVSKLTLMKVEQGEANPTLSVIWKIADGLKISVSSLLAVESEVSIAPKSEGLQLMSTEQNFTVELLFRSNEFELYRGYMKPDSSYQSEAHQSGVLEFITVMDGELIIEVDEKSYPLVEYDSIRFKGDRPHKYTNPSSKTTILHFLISYKNF